VVNVDGEEGDDCNGGCMRSWTVDGYESDRCV